MCARYATQPALRYLMYELKRQEEAKRDKVRQDKLALHSQRKGQ
jgi:hypothetical protein